MSLTVSQLMELPCLRQAKVLAGHKGLSRIVTSVSVLEYSMTTDVQKNLYQSIEFWGSELVITGFCSIASNVDAQCENIRSMAAAGEVGIILYYVGIIMPEVDKRLIELADKLDFVLICMPENDPRLRYSEVIQEVMDAILMEKLNNPAFSTELLGQMIKLPKGQQTVKTILRITSDRLRASTVITDTEYHVLSAASWPRNQIYKLDRLTQMAANHRNADSLWEIKGERPLWAYRAEIQPSNCGRMILLAFSEGEKLDTVLWKQAVEGIRLCMGVWGKQHDQINLVELVRAILLDEPVKMRRLGDLYHIDVEKLSDMWILKSPDNKDLSPWVGIIREFTAPLVGEGLCEPYENDILLFPIGERTLQGMDEWAKMLVAFCGQNGIPARLTCCPALRTTADVRYTYKVNQTCLADTIKIFPNRPWYLISDVEFVQECRQIAGGGQENIQRYTALLEPVLQRKDGMEIVKTLAVYLLDQASSIMGTAQCLFVHKNTVKYRLQKAGDLMGFRVGSIPGSNHLMYALALERLIPSSRED